MLHDWSTVLVLEGATVLGGCSLIHMLWQELPATAGLWGPIFATKLVQIALMLFIAARFRPRAEAGLTAVERHIWTMVPTYFAGFLAIVVVREMLGIYFPLAPFLAALIAMVFLTLGATPWGRFYVWGAIFWPRGADCVSRHRPLLLGVGWFVCLGMGAHAAQTR